MFTAFSTALSGLNAMTGAIDVIGNNLANLDTTGYKTQGVSFKELISEAIGGTASSQVGLGTARPDTAAQFTQGALTTTGGKYDAAIQGDGFFVVKNPSAGGGQVLYTRDGTFDVDANGYIVTSGGERVQGWSGANNVVNTNGLVGDIQVPTGTSLQPAATTNISLAANLDSADTPIVPMAAMGSNSGAIAITTGSYALSLGINGAAPRTFTLNPTDSSITAAASDLNTQFTTAGISATATVNAVTHGLDITSTSAAGGVQVFNDNANTLLGLSVGTATASVSGTGSGTIPITAGSNTLSLGINGAAATPFTLNLSDTTIAAVVSDLNSQFTAAKLSATASVNATGGLNISAAGGVQVFSGNANTLLGLSVAAAAASVSGTVGGTIPITAGSNTLSLAINGAAAATYTLNLADTSIAAVVSDLNTQFAANGATATVNAAGGLNISAAGGVQVLTGTANALLGLTPGAAVTASLSGTVSGPITMPGQNNTLSLGINGAAAQTFTLSSSDGSIAAAASDLNSQFAAAKIGATATVDAVTGGLDVTSTSVLANAGVQVFSGTANAPLGLSVTSTASTINNTFSTGVIQAVDSLGNQIPLTLSFTKQTTNGTWAYSVSSAMGTVSGGSGFVQFDNAGTMTNISSRTVSADGKSDQITISNLPDGAATISTSWSFFDKNGAPNFTQYSEASAASANSQNGQVPAELTSVSLGDGGQVLATYSSGTQQVVGQLAMATIRNPTSLLGSSDNNYSLGADSASPTIGTAGTGGRGTISGGAVEGSTVDIAGQFADLLTYQRSYQANSRVITVSDELNQETVNLIK